MSKSSQLQIFLDKFPYLSRTCNISSKPEDDHIYYSLNCQEHKYNKKKKKITGCPAFIKDLNYNENHKMHSIRT